MDRFRLPNEQGILEVVSKPSEMAERACELFSKSVQDKLQSRPYFSVVLSGGSTPQGMFRRLAKSPYREKIEWNRIHFFWGDERNVPPEHPESNFKLAYDLLLQPLNISENNIHRICPELGSAEIAADAYEQELRNFFKPAPPTYSLEFDLAFLGMGSDGHTASLFPKIPISQGSPRNVLHFWVPHFQAYRITLMPSAFNGSHQVVFLIEGQDKSSTLKSVLESEPEINPYPIQKIHPTNGNLLWLVDQAAASQLNYSKFTEESKSQAA